MDKGDLLSHLSSSFGPPTSGETLYSFLRMGKESKERGWALVEFLAQINNDERDSQRISLYRIFLSFSKSSAWLVVIFTAM